MISHLDCIQVNWEIMLYIDMNTSYLLISIVLKRSQSQYSIMYDIIPCAINVHCGTNIVHNLVFCNTHAWWVVGRQYLLFRMM